MSKFFAFLAVVLGISGSPDATYSNQTLVPGHTLAQEEQVLEVLTPLVAKWEGLELKPYRDIVGVLTWCYGETNGTPKASYTKAECDEMLKKQLRNYHRALLPYFSEDTLRNRLSAHRHAAFDDLGYNCGVAGIGRSTAMKRLNAGDIKGACVALTWWNKAGGRTIRGLTNRRTEDYGYCMVGVN